MKSVPTPNVVYKCHIAYRLDSDLNMNPTIVSVVDIDADSQEFAQKAAWNSSGGARYDYGNDSDDDVLLEVNEAAKLGVSFELIYIDSILIQGYPGPERHHNGSNQPICARNAFEDHFAAWPQLASALHRTRNPMRPCQKRYSQLLCRLPKSTEHFHSLPYDDLSFKMGCWRGGKHLKLYRI